MEKRHAWQSNAGDLANQVKRGELSARDVMQSHLDRIDTVNGSVNAVVARFDDEALSAADAADEALRRGEPLGPLHGVPVSVKINLDVAGQASDQGLHSLADVLAEEDAPIIRKLRAAGAIFHARTNMPDFGMRWNTDNALHGPTRNPWDATRSPGGSSGGCAVAVATGMSPLSIGNDYGGSIRTPAAYNGIPSLRPTPGRLPTAVDPSEPDGLTVQLFYAEGPLARSVADLELALSVMRTDDPADPFWVDASLGESGPCRVLLVRGWLGVDVHPEVSRALDLAARHLEDAGYIVEEGEMPRMEEALALWRDLSTTEIDMFVPKEAFAEATEPSRRWVETAIATSNVLDKRDYADGYARRVGVAGEWRTQMEKTPVILAPVDTDLAFPTEFDATGDIARVFEVLRPRFAMNFAGSLLGLPAVTVPVGVGESGMPQTVQLVSWRFREQRALTAAADIEARAGAFTPRDPRTGTGGGE
ncbi:amidase family protein [Okibacterium endophyticum]